MDAWTLGGIDPASGTSVLVEMARTFGHIKEESSKSSNTLKVYGQHFNLPTQKLRLASKANVDVLRLGS